MMFGDYFQMAINSIRANRLRSLLTMLGIIIGVVGVITSIGIGEGVKQQLSRETSKLGQDVLSIRPGNVLERDQSGLISGVNTLSRSSQSGSAISEKDLEIVREADQVNTVVPLSLITGLPKTDTREYPDAVVIGTTTNLPEMLQHNIEFGGFFSGDDEGKNVAVIGANVAEKLMGEYTPLGDRFTFRGQEFIVRGVFEEFESSALSQGIDFNNAIFIPYSTAKDISGGNINFYEMLAKVNNQDEAANAEAAITKNMSALRGGEKDFTILRANESLASANSVVRLITTLVIVVAAISMTVGGIGIMNIMLVSVTERTREIGIRKAVGATDAQIGSQFVVEAAVLSVWGAAIGLIVAGLVNLFLRIVTNLEPVIVWEVVLFSAAASVFIGVVFGAAPAYKAARKNPIDALRS